MGSRFLTRSLRACRRRTPLLQNAARHELFRPMGMDRKERQVRAATSHSKPL